MKKGKELKIDLFTGYNITYGSIDNLNPKALYINISTWAEPIIDDDTINYSRVIKNINKKIKQNLFNRFSLDDETKFIFNKTIIDLDIRKSGLKFGKKSFANCEITLFLKDEIKVNSLVMRPILDDLSKFIIDTSFKQSTYFKFYNKKK